MFRQNERRQGMTKAIRGLWLNWAIGFGVLTGLTIASPLVPHIIFIAMALIGVAILLKIRGTQRKGKMPVCCRLNQQVTAVIFVAVVVTLAVSLAVSLWDITELTGEAFNSDTPLLIILVNAPVAVGVSLSFLLNRREPYVCQTCKATFGNVIEQGFIGGLYRREWRFQTRLLCGLTLVLAVVDWTYYLNSYTNVTFTREDMFFFVWLPASTYVLSLVYLGFRCYALWNYYCNQDEGNYVRRPGTTTLRYLIIQGDRMLLNFRGVGARYLNDAVMKKFDTPAIDVAPYHAQETPGEADMTFRRISGIRDFESKPVYESADTVTFQNIFHYFIFVPEDLELADTDITGEWFTWGNILQMARQDLLTRELLSEIERIYTVVMAWKTYDITGRCIYPIKHYRPTFRLRDLHLWDVDYNDPRWLRVARYNQDKWWYPLWGLLNIRTLCRDAKSPEPDPRVDPQNFDRHD